MNYIEARLPRCIVYLTPDELNNLLQNDPVLFAAALKRGKAFNRARDARDRKARIRP